MAVYTFTQGEKLTANLANTYMTNGGLVYIGTTSFSAVTSFNGSANVFSSTFLQYRLIIKWINTNSYDALSLRLRTGSTTNTSNNYLWGGSYWGNNVALTSNNSGAAAVSSFSIGTSGEAGYQARAIIDLYMPQATEYTGYTTNVQRSGTSCIGYSYNGQMSVNTSYDSFTFLSGGGNMTGDVIIYGYRNA